MQSEWISGNVFIRPNSLPKKGDRIDGHKHNFDHTTIIFKGAVHVIAKLEDGTRIERDFAAPGHPSGAPSHCLIRAGVEHEITALDDGTVFWCVYSHNTPQATISQVYDGWQEAYC